MHQSGEDPIAVRLTGIDAPEIEHPDDPTNWFRFRQEQPFGRANLDIVNETVGTDDLSVIVDPSAKTYGRYIGLVYQGPLDGDNPEPLNMQFTRQGLAAALPFGDSGSDMYPREKFLGAESEAISANKGMWQSEFFQRYLDLSRGVGGRLTLNTLTDLSRTGRNYHLAAAVEGLWSDEPVEPWKMKYIGQKLIPSHGRFFASNRAGTYNTIEGLPHGGMGQQMRQGMTDFGSPYRGDVNSSRIAAQSRRRSTLFFDLETGGFNPESNQILSLGYKKEGRSAREIYATPEDRWSVSEFSKKNIIPQMAGKDQISEQDLVKRFIHKVRGSQVISGYNIGYPDLPGGFDIPFFTDRARIFGLEGQFAAAIKGKEIRDVGREAQAAIARGMLVTDASIRHTRPWSAWNKARDIARQYSDLPLSELGRQIPYQQTSSGYKPIVQGWRLGVMSRALGLDSFAEHAAGADAAATEEVARHLERIAGGDREFFERWSRYAPADFLAKGVAQRGESYDIAAKLTKKAGIFAEFSELLTDAGYTHHLNPAKPTKGKLTPRQIAIGVGLGLAIPAMGALLFSGRDDEYNTIQGLVHGGQAEKKRRELTEFGSGWIGQAAGSMKKFVQMSRKEFGNIIKQTKASYPQRSTAQAVSGVTDINISQQGLSVSQYLNTTEEGMELAARALGQKLTPSLKTSFFSHELSELHYTGRDILKKAKGRIPSVISSEAEISQAWDIVDKEIIPSMSSFGSHRTPAVIAEEALAAAKMGNFQEMKSARMHETASLENLYDIIADSYSSPSLIASAKKSLAAYPSELTPEYISRVKKIYSTIEKNWLPKFEQAAQNSVFSGKDDAYNVIQGLHPGAGPKSRWKDGFDEFGSGWKGIFGAAWKGIKRSNPLVYGISAMAGGTVGGATSIGLAIGLGTATATAAPVALGAGVALGVHAGVRYLGRTGRTWRALQGTFAKNTNVGNLIGRIGSLEERRVLRTVAGGFGTGSGSHIASSVTQDLVEKEGYSAMSDFVIHAAPSSTRTSIMSTGRLLPGSANVYHEGTNVGVYASKPGTPLYRSEGNVDFYLIQNDKRFVTRSKHAGFVATENQSVSLGDLVEKKIEAKFTKEFIPNTSETSSLFTDLRGMRQSYVISRDLSEMSESGFHIPAVINSLRRKSSFNQSLEASIRDTQRIENFGYSGFSKALDKLSALLQQESQVISSSVLISKHPSFGKYNTSHIARPTLVRTETGGASVAFGKAEEAGHFTSDTPDMMPRLRGIAADIEKLGGQLHIKGGSAREILISALKDRPARASKDIDLLVTGNVKSADMYGVLEKHQTWADFETTSDLGNFFKSTDMTANQAVIRVPSVGDTSLSFTRRAAEDVNRGKVRYTDLENSYRSHQRIDKFNTYWDDISVEAYSGDLGPTSIISSVNLRAENIRTAAGHGGIEGLGHGKSLISEGRLNQTASARKKTTPFGSGYDPIRALAKLTGKTFDEIIGSPAFKQAMSQGRHVRTLGEGTFGTVSLFETTFAGKPFQYVRKDLFDNAIERARVRARQVVESKGLPPERAEDAFRQWAPSLDVRNEAAALRKLGDLETIPSVYGVSGSKHLFMEAMPGVPVNKTSGVSSKAMAALQRDVEATAQRGLRNTDIHQGNILYDAQKDRAAWIDWGVAKKFDPNIASNEMAKDMAYIPIAKKAPPPLPPPPAMSTAPAKPGALRKLKQAEAQKQAASNMFSSGINGGKGHRRY